MAPKKAKRFSRKFPSFLFYLLLFFSPILVIDSIKDVNYFFWFIEEMNNLPMLLSIFSYIVKDKARKDLYTDTGNSQFKSRETEERENM